MSEAALVAREIQDLASAVGDVATAVDRAAAVPPPVVNVQVPEAPPPVVNVQVPEAPPPVVNVASGPVEVHNEVNVPRAAPHAYRVQITERDKNGFIESFTITPL